MTILRPPTQQTEVPHPQPYRGIPGLQMTTGRWLTGWRPEDPAQWAGGGIRIAPPRWACAVG